MRRSLLSIRSALVLALALLTGIGAGVLSAFARTSPAQCVLYGAGTFGVAVPFFDRLVGSADENQQTPASPSGQGSGTPS